MRIRKHAKSHYASIGTSTSISSHVPGRPQTHVCQLNRSLWDVATLSPPQSDPPYQQDETVEDVMSNPIADGPESIEAVASLDVVEVEVMKKSNKRKMKKKQQKKKPMGLLREAAAAVVVMCNKQDGRGWRCKREAKSGSSLCEYHLNQLRSYHWYPKRRRLSDAAVKRPTPIKKAAAVVGRPRLRTASAVSGSDFYYYSGFGPRWGKTRRVDGEEEDEEVGGDDEDEAIADDDEDDYDDDDDDDGYDNKRARKPLKSRSLKSLL